MRSLYGLIIALSPVIVFAQDKAPQPNSGGIFGSMLPMMVIMFAIIYFLMIRPEQRKQKQRQKMLTEMKKGDKVVTAGGIYGVISGIKNDVVTVKIAENTHVDMTKSAVSSVITKEGAEKETNGKESK